MKKELQDRNNARTARSRNLMRAIMALLNWDEQQYADIQYEQGLSYLASYLEEDKFYADQLSRSKIFWWWWRNHWTNRDESFLSIHEQVSVSGEMRRALYAQYNDGVMLAGCIHPNSVVLNETYADMISVLVKGETMAI